LGLAPIDTALATELAAALPEFVDDPDVLAAEHSIEVQLPFLQHLWGPEVPFVPLQMLNQGRDATMRVGTALGEVLAGEEAIIIASTDFTHQESRARAESQDRWLIDRLLALDAEGLLAEREKRNVTMCGYGPTAAMMLAAKAGGARRATVYRYGDSAEAHPMDAVVAYLAAGVYR
jgi:AmmeMemoRadiSam system protein B